MTGVAAIGLLFPDHPRTDLRRVSYPEFVALLGEHTLKPVGSPGGFHPDARRSLKCYLKLVGFASPMVQSRIQYFARYRINHRYPLKPCVEIAIRLGASLNSSLPSLGRSITTQSTRSQEANCAFSARPDSGASQ